MDCCIEEAFASALGCLAVAGILCDVGDQARIEDALLIVRGVKAAIEIEIGTSEVQSDLFGYAFQLRLSRFKLAGLRRFCRNARGARPCMHLRLNRDKLNSRSSTLVLLFCS